MTVTQSQLDVFAKLNQLLSLMVDDYPEDHEIVKQAIDAFRKEEKTADDWIAIGRGIQVYVFRAVDDYELEPIQDISFC